ncbi:MAG: o-succinylbenzoate synthase [Candidatus Hydrogenedentota bacterium]
MIIAGAQVYRYRLPLREPVVLKGNTYREREGLLLCLRDDAGREGWGESAPLAGFSRESLEAAEAALRHCAARLRGYRLPDHYDDLEGSGLLQTHGVQSVSFAIEAAYYNLLALTRGVLPCTCINFDAPGHITLNALLLGEPRAVIAQAARATAEGYGAVKLKVGARSIDEEVELVHAVRDTLGPAVGLRLDANRAWPLDTAVAFGRRVADCNIEYIEEPLRDPVALPDFERRTQVPYALDETLQTWQALQQPPEADSRERFAMDAYQRALNRVYSRAAACVWKPTLMHVPNLVAAIAWGMFFPMKKIVLSAAFESGVGIAALVNYAAAYSGAETPVGLDTYAWLGEDVLASRLPLDQAHVDVTTVTAAARFVRREALTPRDE